MLLGCICQSHNWPGASLHSIVSRVGNLALFAVLLFGRLYYMTVLFIGFMWIPTFVYYIVCSKDSTLLVPARIVFACLAFQVLKLTWDISGE